MTGMDGTYGAEETSTKSGSLTNPSVLRFRQMVTYPDDIKKHRVVKLEKAANDSIYQI